MGADIWHIPWSERGQSGAVKDNVLWQSGPLYVMDNHRLAPWCWWQHIDQPIELDLLHIDRHYDALWTTKNPWVSHFRPVHATDLAEYRSARWNGDMELYRWDTVLSALWSRHADKIRDCRFAGCVEGDRPPFQSHLTVNPWQLPAELDWLADAPTDGDRPSILDIDIDYFTRHQTGQEDLCVFSDRYIADLGKAVRKGIDSGRFAVVTIALSPETTGSWALAESIVRKLADEVPALAGFVSGAP